MELYGDFRTSVEKALGEIDPDWESYRGVVICGSHQPLENDIDRLLDIIRQARVNGTPLLGICYGHQLAAIEYARNVLGINDATSEEFGQGTFVVKKRPTGLYVGLKDGETYWSYYEVDLPGWEKPKNFITVQFHPEYQSSIDKPHPILKEFIDLCRNGSVG